jgi:hypothetical protein
MYTLTTDHAASSYHQPVLVGPDGTAYGPLDAPNLFGETPADQVRNEMTQWAQRVNLALGFAPWASLATKMLPPHDPKLADDFCRLAGMDPCWQAFAESLTRA